MLYPFEWQKLTNSCGKLFARANLAALLCQSKDKKKGGPENLERPWFGDLGQSVASEGTGKVWGRPGMNWHLFLYTCPAVSAFQMCGFYWQARCSGGWKHRFVLSFMHSALLKHCMEMCKVAIAPEGEDHGPAGPVSGTAAFLLNSGFTCNVWLRMLWADISWKKPSQCLSVLTPYSRWNWYLLCFRGRVTVVVNPHAKYR